MLAGIPVYLSVELTNQRVTQGKTLGEAGIQVEK